MTGAWRVAQADASHWGLAVKNGLDRLSPLPDDANLGFVYVTGAFADDLSSIVTFLRETTPITTWLGASGHGVFGPDGEIHQGPGLVLMAGHIASDQARPFAGFGAETSEAFLVRHKDWLAAQSSVTALVHGDPRDPAITLAVHALAETTQAFLVGGLTEHRQAPGQVGGGSVDGGLSGVLLGDRVMLATGLTQGCAPIGEPHRVTKAIDNIVMDLDGRPALSTLKEEVGDIIARDLKRAAGYIHIACPVEGSDRADYLVRGLLAIDPERGWLAVGERMVAGDQLFFVRRDPNSAQNDFQRMLKEMADRLDGRPIKGGLYISCLSRGESMFGKNRNETAMIHERLGDFPLVGFSANGEISGDRIYGYTGVLALFL